MHRGNYTGSLRATWAGSAPSPLTPPIVGSLPAPSIALSRFSQHTSLVPNFHPQILSKSLPQLSLHPQLILYLFLFPAHLLETPHLLPTRPLPIQKPTLFISMRKTLSLTALSQKTPHSFFFYITRSISELNQSAPAK